MDDDLSTQRRCRAGNRLDGLVKDPHIVGVADMSLNSGRVDPNPPRLYRTGFEQLLDQMFIKISDPLFAKSLIELNQGRRVRDWIHQRKAAEIPPPQFLSDSLLYFFVAQAPTKFQVHHPQIDPDRCTWTTPESDRKPLQRL